MTDLAVKKDNALRVATKLGVKEAIKPLEKEIFLDDVFVRDVLLDSQRLIKLKKGDDLLLKREDQPYDPLIVAVYKTDKRIGELAEFDEGVFARLLDAGKKLVAKVKNVVISPIFNSLEISITMIDF